MARGAWAMSAKVAAAVLILILAAGGFFYLNVKGAAEAETAEELRLSGNVDVREVSLAFRQSDRISEIFAEEGDTVTTGQVLAKLDSRELELTIAAAKSQVHAQEAALLKLKNGNRPEDIAQAESKVRAARADADNAFQHFDKIRRVYEETDGSAITRDELETARLTYNAKVAALEEAQQAHSLAAAGARYEDIAAAEGQLQYLKDELARQEFLLTQYELVSPTDGVIRSRLLEVGDMASPSAPLFKISLNTKKWVRAYVSEPDLGKIFEGQPAQIFIDSLPNAPIAGQIGYISDTAEFTPKTVQTDELRTSLVYEIRVFADDGKNLLRLGMPATVVIPLK